MVSMDVNRWKQNIYEALADIASREYQESTWFGGSDRISSPEEVYCTLFDDFAFDDFLESEFSNLSENQTYNGKILGEKMSFFFGESEDYLKPKEVIDDPNWIEIRDIARKIIDGYTLPGDRL
jgi:hypothetical protein